VPGSLIRRRWRSFVRGIGSPEPRYVVYASFRNPLEQNGDLHAWSGVRRRLSCVPLPSLLSSDRFAFKRYVYASPIFPASWLTLYTFLSIDPTSGRQAWRSHRRRVRSKHGRRSSVRSCSFPMRIGRATRADPSGFLRSLSSSRTVGLDEIQAIFGEEALWIYNVIRGVDHTEGELLIHCASSLHHYICHLSFFSITEFLDCSFRQSNRNLSSNRCSPRRTCVLPSPRSSQAKDGFESSASS
jgi:hypothetical protein